MKILIACDKFRGSLDGREVAKCLAQGLLEADPKLEITSSDVADGGEGTLDVLSKAYNTHSEKIKVRNAIGEEIFSTMGYNAESKVAVLEMASYVGLAMLDSANRNPMKTSSYGLGQTIKKAVELGAKTITIGIGGSATNDGGTGALEAIGFKFLDSTGKLISPVGGNLNLIEKIAVPDSDPLDGAKIIIASDVNNPICGPQGASFVYGKQKGATDADLVILDNNLHYFAKLVSEFSGNEVFQKEGYGAAGGVGLSLCELLGAELKSGSELIFESLGLRKMIERSDVVITGEGKIDHQTGHGKAITPIVEAALELNKNLFLVCGVFDEGGAKELDSLPRYELADLAKELGRDSFSDAADLTIEIGRRIGLTLK